MFTRRIDYLFILNLSVISSSYAMEGNKVPFPNNPPSNQLIVEMQKNLLDIYAALEEIKILNQQSDEKEKAHEKFKAYNTIIQQETLLDMMNHMEKLMNGQMTAEAHADMKQKLLKRKEEQEKVYQEVKAVLEKPLGSK